MTINKFLLLFALLSPNISFSENVDLCFSPYDTCYTKIINVINNTKSKLYISIFSLTDKEISDSIISAHNKNIEIKIFMDNKQAYIKGSKYLTLINHGVNVKLSKSYNYMHNKYIISDRKLILTGSYNFSLNARKNAENVIILYDLDIVNKYEQNFEQIWAKF